MVNRLLASNSLTNRRQNAFWLMAVVFVISAVLSFYRLDNAYFWDDEAYVGIVAKNFLKFGAFTGWTGRNLYAQPNGLVLTENLRPINPPLDALATAASFLVFGAGTWAARIPHVMTGLLMLCVFGLYLRREFPLYPALQLYCFASLALSVPFLLYIRTCRYYALAMLFSFGAYACYRLTLKTSSDIRRKLIGFGLCLTGLFYASFLLCAVFLGSLAITHCLFHRKDWNKKQYLQAGAAAGLFALLTMPYAVRFHIWLRPDIYFNEPWVFQRPYLILWDLRDLALSGFLPISFTIALTAIWIHSRVRAFRARSTPQAAQVGAKEETDSPVAGPGGVLPAFDSSLIAEWGCVVISYIFILGLSTKPPSPTALFGEVRYWIPLLPFCAGLTGILLWHIHRRTKTGALLLFLLVICTNLPAVIPWRTNYRLLLPGFIKEINNPYPTASSEVVNFLRSRARPDATMYGYPAYTNIPITFYMDEQLKVCCILDRTTHLPRPLIRQLHAPLYIEENFPDWYVAYGAVEKDNAHFQILSYFARRHPENGKIISYSYVFEKRLDVTWDQTQRPELFMHSFGPVREFPANDAIYIYKKAGYLVHKSMDGK